MNEESLKIAKKIERLKREFSMLPSLTERHSILEIEEYQHYLLELEELLIVFKYLCQTKQQSSNTVPELENEKEVENHTEETPSAELLNQKEESIAILEEVEKIEAEVKEIIEAEEKEEVPKVDDDIEEVPEEVIPDLQEKLVDVIETPSKEETEVNDKETERDSPTPEVVVTGASLNDQITPTDNSLANKLAKQPISDLRNAFGLNERFLFANELFGGDGQEFIRALNELNHLENFEDAKRMLEARYENNFGWNKDDENVIAFVDVVERRYL